MKLATWNLERGGRKRAARVAQEAVLRELDANIMVLTEPPADYTHDGGVVRSPPRIAGRTGEAAWVVVAGFGVEPVPFEVPYERTSVVARADVGGVKILVYGCVLPWLAVKSHAPELVRDGESSFATFERVLAEQANDIRELRRRYGEPVVWAGDFNQAVTGGHQGGSKERRDLLVKTLGALGLIAWNARAPHAKNGLSAVDLICGPSDCEVIGDGRIDPHRGDLTLSDHAGYWVELGLRR